MKRAILTAIGMANLQRNTRLDYARSAGAAAAWPNGCVRAGLLCFSIVRESGSSRHATLQTKSANREVACFNEQEQPSAGAPRPEH